MAAALQSREQRQAFEVTTRSALVGLAHSIMVTLDGGGAYSDHGARQLLHPNGDAFPAGPHEWLFEHLDATGRLP
jgi:hypothetical protein